MNLPDFYTIGVYGSTEESFFRSLIQNGIDTFCDIRNRRGVRGAKYSYVNSKRLQTKLQELGIKYFHIETLAPTKDIRELQAKADKEKGILKSERQSLGDVFVSTYKNRVLNHFDFEKFLLQLNENNSHKVVLFCVEQEACACHRSIVSDQITNVYKIPIKHL